MFDRFKRRGGNRGERLARNMCNDGWTTEHPLTCLRRCDRLLRPRDNGCRRPLFKHIPANPKGFSLVEVTASLAIFTILIAGSAPLLTKTVHERMTINQHLFAYEWIENALAEWTSSSQTPPRETTIEKLATEYKMTAVSPSDVSVRFCVTWKGKNKRWYRVCGSGKRTL